MAEFALSVDLVGSKCLKSVVAKLGSAIFGEVLIRLNAFYLTARPMRLGWGEKNISNDATVQLDKHIERIFSIFRIIGISYSL